MDYAYAGENNYKEIEPRQFIHVVDYREGEDVGIIDQTDFCSSPDDYEIGGLMNHGLKESTLEDGWFYAHNPTSCLKIVYDFEAWKAGDDDNDCVRYFNGNGDYIFDKRYEPDAESPWACSILGTSPTSDGWNPDSNKITNVTANGIGAVSFFMLGPDGTGMGVYTIAGETDGWKSYNLIVDTDSAYDGLYTAPAQPPDSEAGSRPDPGYFFVGNDSAKGILTAQPVAVESRPSGFDVSQNVPNPFNPTTTINFSTAKAGNVSIDVFNVAGQKIDTIASEFMSAGNHSVTWNATDFSAGVYFYTVRAGDFSKTMKMTLLK
jgi:hypothetical protein